MKKKKNESQSERLEYKLFKKKKNGLAAWKASPRTVRWSRRCPCLGACCARTPFASRDRTAGPCSQHPHLSYWSTLLQQRKGKKKKKKCVI
jgi:hypothetical protein